MLGRRPAHHRRWIIARAYSQAFMEVRALTKEAKDRRGRLSSVTIIGMERIDRGKVRKYLACSRGVGGRGNREQRRHWQVVH